MYYHEESIKEACRVLSIPSCEFELLDSEKGKETIDLIKNKIGDRQNLLAFKLPYCTGYEREEKGFECLNSLIEDYQNYVWFLVDPFWEVSRISIYKASPKHIQNVIAECFGFEYCIVSLQLDWLIAEDDNSCFYFVGEYAIDRAKIKLSNEPNWNISNLIKNQPLNLYIKSIWSRELKPIIGGKPSNIKDFYIPVEVAISELGKQGGKIFHFVAASPSQSESQKVDRFHNKILTIASFDWEKIQNHLNLLIKETCSNCCYWDEVEETLSSFLNPGTINN